MEKHDFTRDLAQSERTLRLLRHCHDALFNARDETTLLESICRHLVEEGGYAMAQVAYADGASGSNMRRIMAQWLRPGVTVSCNTGMTGIPLQCGATVYGVLSVLTDQDGETIPGEALNLLREVARILAHGIAGLREQRQRQTTTEQLHTTLNALRDSENRFRTLLEHLSQMIFLKDIHSTFVMCNAPYATLRGIRADQIAGRTDFDFSPPHLAEKYRADDQAVMREGVTREFEERYVNHQGQQGWVQTVKTPVRDAQGQITGVLGIFWDITERKQLEEELRHHRDHLDRLVQERTTALNTAHQELLQQSAALRRYATIVSASQDHISLLNRQYIYLAVNDTYLRYNGKERQEIEGHSVAELLGEEVFQRIRPELDRCLAGESVNYQKWFTFATGRRCWMDVSYHPCRAEGGQIEGLVVIARDATERKLVEDALSHSEQRFALFMQQLPGVACIKDRAGRYVFVNQGLERMIGRPMHDILNHMDEEIWPANTAYLLRAHDALVWTNNQVQQFTEVYDLGYGPSYWVVQKFPIPGEDGEALLLGGVGVEITERVLAERASQDMAKFPMENPNPVGRVDGEGRILFLNPVAQQVLSLAQDVQIGEPVPEPFRETSLQALRDGCMRHMEWMRGEQVYSAMVVPIIKFGYVNLYLVEITALKQALQMVQARQFEVETLNARLEQRVREAVEENRRKDFVMMQQSRLAAMGEMIGHIAHQWRQPINALGLLLANIADARTYGELDQAFLDQQMAQGRSIIHRMSTTIDDFRNFFKPSRQRETFDMGAVIRDAILLVNPSMANHGVEVRFEVRDTLLSGHGYPNEFAQVILVLLDNAKDAIRETGKARGRIDVFLEQTGERAVLRVQDNGCGIPNQHLDRIFDPYFTTKEDSKGTGIGLYMAKMIVEEHMEGRIRAHRHGEEGTEFVIDLPLA